ncbi:MAG: site-specific integrase [Vicinamibacterales bacterium]
MAGKRRARGAGEGNIYRRDDGRWVGRLSDRHPDGRRRRVCVYGKTRSEVVEALRKRLEAQQQGMVVSSGRTALRQFLESWLEESVKPKVRVRTYASYEQVVRLHIRPRLGHIPLSRLAPQHVQAWMNELVAGGLSARTCLYARAVLRASLSTALRWGLVSRNVATLVDAPRAIRQEIAPLDPDQARSLLASLQGHRLQALFTVAVALGLRQGEALGLRWDSVDFDGRALHVRAALQRTKRQWQLVEPKSARSRRSIPMPDVVVEALRAHRTRQFRERLLAGEKWRDTGLVFVTRTGTPLESRNVTRTFQNLLKRAGLPRIRFHDLRHTAATLLLAQGVDPRTIMETLGHSQISLTLNTYSHVLPVLKRDAADRMNELLVG